jgi:hypothetical protein
VILTNPRKTHVIAEAKIKNDKLDARLLADLVMADLVARSTFHPKRLACNEPYYENASA